MFSLIRDGRPCIREPEIFELADIEPELFNHRIHTCNSQIHIRFSEIHMIVGVTFVPEKEIRDRQMPYTDPSIGAFISI